MRTICLSFIGLLIGVPLHSSELTWNDTPAKAHLTQREKKAIGFERDNDFRVRRVSLKNDYDAVIAQGTGDQCGASGNCSFVLIESGTAKVLLTAIGIQTIDILAGRHAGLRDIALGAHASAMRHDFFVFRYDGRKYRPARCYMRDFMPDLDGPEKQAPKDTALSCKLVSYHSH